MLPNVLLVGLGLLVTAHCGYHIWRGSAARRWPTTPGKIGARPRSRWWLFPVPAVFGRFTYTYRVSGQEFVGRRIWFGSDLAFSVPNPAYTWLGDSFLPGAATTVSYNPSNPRESVLKPGVSPGTYVVAGVGVALALVGIGLRWVSF